MNEIPIPFRLKKIVLPQHTDHAGVMWHGAYVSWIEEIRVETLNSVGLNYFDLSSSGYEFPVVSLNIDYKKPLFHGDEVIVETIDISRKGARIIWKSNFLKAGKFISAESSVELVLVRKTGKGFLLIKNMPDFILKGLEKITNAQLN